MTEQQLKMAKVLDEEYLPTGKLVFLDMRSVGIVNVFPQFAVYSLHDDNYFFIAGSNDKQAAGEAFEKAKQKHRKKGG